MPKQDRGAPARPPWLPEEDEQRGFLRSLRRKKRNEGEDASDEDSLTRETEHTSGPKVPALKQDAETVLPPVEHAAVVPTEEKPNGAKSVPDASKYYTPARTPAPVDEKPSTAESNAIAPKPVSEVPRIIASPIPEMKPEPWPIPQVEQSMPPSSLAPPVIPVPEPVAAEPAPVAEEVTPGPVEPVSSVETPVEVDPSETAQEPVQPEEASRPAPTTDASGDVDPFSRFSVLEAKLRQMSLDESITDGELERRQRHAIPAPEPESEPEAPAALSFTPPEVVDDAPDLVEDVAEALQAAEPAPAPALAFTPPAAAADAPEAIDDAPEAVAENVPETAELGHVEAATEVEATPNDEPESVPAEPEPTAGLTADFVPQAPEADADIVGDFVPQNAVVEAPSETAAPSGEPVTEVDDVDARAAALLLRIEAKRAELDEELAAHDAAESEILAEPEPEPMQFTPMVAPWAATEEPAPVEIQSRDDVSTENVAEEPVEPELTASPDPEPVAEETSAASAIEDLAAPGPELPVQLEVSAPQAVDPQPAGDIAKVEPELSVEVPAVPAVPEPSVVVESEPAVEDTAGTADVAEGDKPQRQPGRRLAPPPWQIPSAMQPAPTPEPPAQPAYYVPPPQLQQPGPLQPQPQPPMQQQPAAQAPPGWNPRQPYPGQWSQGAPQAPQPYGGQQLPPQQPPQPTSVQGQWQWVPQQPQAHQPPPQQVPPPSVQQEPPAGYVPSPQATAPPVNYRAPQAYRMPPSLDEAEVVNRSRYAPRSGWRKAVHRSTAGRVNPGDSRKDRENDQLLASIRQPILGDYRIAVLSIKGGVGKTTTTLGLGSAFATIRTDRIIAVDANPDRGTLAERVRDHSTQSTVRDLLNDQNIRSYADVRNHTRMATSRLEVLASEQDPAVSEAFGEVDYRNTIDILQRYYNIILTDCGTGIMHSAMAGVLDLAHTIVLVSSPAMDSARSASATLDWLMQHGHSGLVREAHVVLSASRPGSAGIKLDKVYEHFEARCRSIHMIPFDPHLAEGADVDFNLLNADTNEAYLGLAGAISESFPRLRMRGDEQR
ncbi:AAA family ATPase [Mycobacteroides sp. LB1]|uniref:AAA family ATPase n=1 Tax=Mycobacteroides sp. LB1 TaxID=2750814 RepID=UPI0015DDA2DB|nr:AAA family ATPase [Mycobacteroides sp. LB1]